MFLSRRRLWWGLVAALLLACCITFRPVRSWIDQAMVARLINRDASVGQLHIHRDTSVVEARDLRWSHVNGQRSFGFASRRAWFAIDAEQLLDRRFAFPRVVLEDASLFLDDYSDAPSESRVSVWQQSLTERLSDLDWNEIRNKLRSILAAETLASNWGQQIERWLARSERIVEQSQTLLSETLLFDNPLRFEDELRVRLDRLDQLRDEQRKLLEQFSSVRRQLDAEEQELSKLHEQEAQWLSEQALPDQDSTAAEQLAHEVAESVAELVWHKYAHFGEIADLMTTITVVPHHQDGNQDFRANQFERPLLDVQQLTANGYFACRKQSLPFRLDAELQVPSAPQRPVSAGSHWQYSFQATEQLLRVEVTRDYNADVTNIVAYQLPAENQVEAIDRHMVIETRSRNGQLSGTLYLHSEYLEDFVSPNARLLATASSQHSHEACVAIELGGTWGQPRLAAVQPMPDWLLQRLERVLSEPLERAGAQLLSRHESEFKRQLSMLQELATTASAKAAAAIEGHMALVQADKQQVQAYLDDISEGRFATRPGASSNR